jgi:hypothetical protein
MASLILLLLSCVACAHQPTSPDETLPAASTPLRSESADVIELRVGASAPVPGTTSVISFVGVANDSRCPRGVTCIWEGDAVVSLRVQPQQGEPRTIDLHTSDRFDQQTRIDGVTVRLERLEPYPEKDAPVPADAYRVTLRVGTN